MTGGWDDYNFWRKFRNEAVRFRVYYCRDADGALMYIGCSGDWTTRKRQHRDDTPWWHEVENVTFSPWMTRRDAVALEARAIRLNRPRHNIHHNRSKRVAS